jgi:hypothetical protein
MKTPKIAFVLSIFTTTLLATSSVSESISHQAVLDLKKNLKVALTDALAKGDVASAIEVC